MGGRPRRLAAVLAAVLASSLLLATPATGAAKDPRLTRGMYVDPTTAAAKAARSDQRLKPISSRAQAFWATDRYATSKVKKAVSTYAARATKARRTPVVAVYAIPGRDCGQHSAGGLTATQYRSWITQLAAGLKGRKAMVVLEPDAVAQMGECAGQGDRAALLRHAAAKLKAAGAWTYIDAGHSAWKSPGVVAERLIASGVRDARGFSVNVSNFRRSPDELAYAQQVNAELARRGVTTRRFVIDTARNGAATPPDARDFCNPPTARLGRPPAVVNKGGLDAYVWVKRPGESDGRCHGGPAAGTWWRTGALRLLGKA